MPVDAFILGAGFSIAISPWLPTTNKLGQDALKFVRAHHKSPPRTHSSICDGISCDRPVLRDGKIPSPGENFEIWLTWLAETQPFLFGPDNALNLALYQELESAIVTALSFKVDTALEEPSPPSWLAELVRRWHEQRLPVVSFNYDSLVEATFDWLHLADPEGRTIPQTLLGPTTMLMPSWNVIKSGEPAASLELFKLHGSLNWYWDQRTRSPESMIEIGLLRQWGSKSSLDPPPQTRAPGKVPVIIPPTTSKSSFLDNTTVSTIWRLAFRAIRAADRLFVLGYSLPPADTLVTSMLSAALQAKPKLVYPVDVSPDVAPRFAALVGSTVDETFCNIADPVPTFADWYVADTAPSA